ncbi:MAG: serine hydrolase domain-containing protein [Acidobacteriota bacterium]
MSRFTKRALLLIAAVGCVLAAALGSVLAAQLPSTPAGKRLDEFLGAMNTSSEEKLKAFHTNSTTPERTAQRAARDLDFVRANGNFTILEIVKSTDIEITAKVRTALTEMVFDVSIGVEPMAPHRLTSIGIRAGSAPQSEARKRTDAEIVEALDTLVAKLIQADQFSGAVKLTKSGKTLYEKASGLASIAFNVPNQLDTKFNLGSMNKMFTAVAIAQLAQQGKLTFDDTVGKHLTDYPNKAVAEKVKIHHLLTHTSGIGDYFNQKYQEASKTRFRAVKDYLPLFVDDPLQFEPGERFSYSNAGFLLLGLILERVSGEEYFEYVRRHIYQPAGMTHTDTFEMDFDTPDLAIGYTRDAATGRLRNNLYLHVVKGGPAGGGFSTVNDLVRFAAALMDGTLLEEKYRELLLAGKVEAFGPASKYGYGFVEVTDNGNRMVGHGGGFPGISADLSVYRDQGYVLAALSNRDGGTGPISHKVRELLRQPSSRRE